MYVYEWSEHELSKIVEQTNNMLKVANRGDITVTTDDVAKTVKMPIFSFTKGFENSIAYVTGARKIEPLKNIWSWVGKVFEEYCFEATVQNIHRELVKCINYNPKTFNKFYYFLTDEIYNIQNTFVPDEVNVGLIRRWVRIYKPIEVNTKNDMELKKALYSIILEESDYLPDLIPFEKFISGNETLPSGRLMFDDYTAATQKKQIMVLKALLYLNGYDIVSLNGEKDEEFIAAMADFKIHKRVKYSCLHVSGINFKELRVLFTYKTEDGNE